MLQTRSYIRAREGSQMQWRDAIFIGLLEADVGLCEPRESRRVVCKHSNVHNGSTPPIDIGQFSAMIDTLLDTIGMAAEDGSMQWCQAIGTVLTSRAFAIFNQQTHAFHSTLSASIM
jgi:hypothetical protein